MDNRRGLQQELSDTQVQLDAARNEAEMLGSEKMQEEDEQHCTIEALEHKLQATLMKLIQAKDRVSKNKETITSLRSELTQAENTTREAGPTPAHQTEPSEASGDSKQGVKGVTSSASPRVTQADCRMMTVISTFLNVHPFGASADYLCSYLQGLNFTCKSSDIEDLLGRYPRVFRQEMFGVGASIEKRWNYLFFNDCA